MPQSTTPPRSSRPSLPFPTDYSICSICNLDHRHDVPRLDAVERSRVLEAHVAVEALVPYDLLIAMEAPVR